MGKPYDAELAKLGETYAWALNAPIDLLTAAVSASSNLPLLAVGSGGSYSAAHFAGILHQQHTGLISKPATPLEFVTSRISLRSASAMFLSAGGSNADIISGLENAIRREARRCIALCFREGSKLSQIARKFRYVDLIELNPPAGKDGFLATNSLVAFTVLLERAYAAAFGSQSSLPSRLDDLLGGIGGGHGKSDAVLADCEPLWERETLLVLYSPSVSSAALDLESKFAEAALGNVQLADFRNFAHGRHHWLAKRANSSAVLALFAQNEESLAQKVIGLIPPSVPVAKIRIPAEESAAAIAGIVLVLHLVGSAGRRHDVDPGRPGVPSFGRRIYGLRMLGGFNRMPSVEDAAVARKLGTDWRGIGDRADIVCWRQAYREFVSRLAATAFGAVVFDYDGTLCDELDRFSGLQHDVAKALKKLLANGVTIGVATGRGDSAREALRKALLKSQWDKVYLGYYNGSEIGVLSDDSHPAPGVPTSGQLREALDAVQGHPLISRIAVVKGNQHQISVRAASPADRQLLWRLLQHLAAARRLVVLRSSHSIDIMRTGASKCALGDSIRGNLKEGLEILCIGDQGQWPGNDCELLKEAYSLSVDEVSGDPHTCWNMATPGHRGSQALLEYLSWVSVDSGRIRLTLPSVRGRRK